MDNRRTLKLEGSNSIENTQFNLGDDSDLTSTWVVNNQKIIEQFLEEISKCNDISPEDKQDAIETINDLKEKKEKGTLRESLLKKMWDALPEVVKLFEGAATIYKVFSK